MDEFAYEVDSVAYNRDHTHMCVLLLYIVFMFASYHCTQKYILKFAIMTNDDVDSYQHNSKYMYHESSYHITSMYLMIPGLEFQRTNP